MVIGRALGPVAAGLALGLAATVVTGRLVAALLFGVTPSDGITLVATSLLLVSAAIAASAWPTRAALRVEPIVALRDE